MKVITIGRSTENNDIVVDDVKVSRNHLQMVMDDNGNYSVMDLGSTNGTYVNGQRISGEVRLQHGDEVRIGQTVLPWQNYFATPIVEPSLSPRPPKGPNRTWLYVIIGAALLFLIGGGVAWKVYHDKQKEKIEQEEQNKKDRQERQLEQEANDARVEAARLSEEAEAAARIAAETQSEKDLQYAKQMQEKAQEAKKLAQEKETEWNRMKEQLDAANKAKDAAEEQSRQDAEAKREADSIAEQARQEAEKAKLAQQDAEREAELTKEFYSLITSKKIKEKNSFEKICTEMRWNYGNINRNEYVDFIVKKFDKAKNNDVRQQIVRVTKKVLAEQGKEDKEEVTEAQNNDEMAEPTTPATIDTVKR